MDDRRRPRGNLGLECKGIGLQADDTIDAVDLELVAVALFGLGDDRSPDSRGADRLQLVGLPVPAVPVADDRDAAGVRRPDRERDAVLAHVRPEPLVDPLVAPLSREVKIQLAELHPWSSSMRRMPATGIDTQSGRLCSS